MKKQHAWPEGHWNWPIDVTHKHGMRCGDMMWVGGQVNLSPTGKVLNPGDLMTQTNNVIANFSRVLIELGGELEDLVFLNCFYVNEGNVNENDVLNQIAMSLPEGTRTAITAIPVPYLAYADMLIEIEGVAMRSEDGMPLDRTYSDITIPNLLSEKFCSAVRCGKMIFVSAQSAIDSAGSVLNKGQIVEQTNTVMSYINQTLSSFGAGFTTS